jgi:hypothetical protein
LIFAKWSQHRGNIRAELRAGARGGTLAEANSDRRRAKSAVGRNNADARCCAALIERSVVMTPRDLAIGVSICLAVVVAVMLAEQGETSRMSGPVSVASATTKTQDVKLNDGGGPSAKDVMQVLHFEQKVEELVGQWKKAQAASDRDKVEAELHGAVEAQFRASLDLQQLEIAQLEAEAKQLREQLELRGAKHKEIVDFRVQQLLRDEQGLGWNSELPPGTSIRTRTRTSGNQTDVEHEIGVDSP